MQARAASSHAELLGLQRLQMRYPLRSLRSFSLAMTSRPHSNPPLLMRPCKHAQRAAMRSCRGFHAFRCLRACRPSVLPLPLLTCHGSHPCCNSATDSRGRRPTPWCRRGTYHHPLPSLGHRHTAYPSCRTNTAQGTRGITSPTALRSMLIDHTSLFDHRGGGSA
jgi:hypothetical protein